MGGPRRPHSAARRDKYSEAGETACSAMPEKNAQTIPSESAEQDKHCVARALAGDQRAYAELLEKYRSAIRRHIQKIIRDRMIVDDLVQEVFAKAFAALSSYSSAYAFSTWLYKIAQNHAIDYNRKKKLPTLSIDQPVETRDGEMKIELPDTTYRPDRHIVQDERKTLIQEAIDALPAKYNRVIVLRHQHEKSYEEIAQKLDLPLGTVKAHLFRARQALNKYLRDRRDLD